LAKPRLGKNFVEQKVHNDELWLLFDCNSRNHVKHPCNQSDSEILNLDLRSGHSETQVKRVNVIECVRDTILDIVPSPNSKGTVVNEQLFNVDFGVGPVRCLRDLDTEVTFLKPDMIDPQIFRSLNNPAEVILQGAW
jgi:hypothetical protein